MLLDFELCTEGLDEARYAFIVDEPNTGVMRVFRARVASTRFVPRRCPPDGAQVARGIALLFAAHGMLALRPTAASARISLMRNILVLYSLTATSDETGSVTKPSHRVPVEDMPGERPHNDHMRDALIVWHGEGNLVRHPVPDQIKAVDQVGVPR